MKFRMKLSWVSLTDCDRTKPNHVTQRHLQMQIHSNFFTNWFLGHFQWYPNIRVKSKTSKYFDKLYGKQWKLWNKNRLHWWVHFILLVESGSLFYLIVLVEIWKKRTSKSPTLYWSFFDNFGWTWRRGWWSKMTKSKFSFWSVFTICLNDISSLLFLLRTS